MNKTIYITEKQKKHIKKAIAAQDQVGGKVNAGVMDAVVGGMCENVEDDKYELAPEKNEMSPYYHVNEENNGQENMFDIDNIIYTDVFKDWFGDWQGDPQNSSKVVDENGFPIVVYHGSPKFFGDSFDKKYIGHSMNFGEQGIFCTTQDITWARRFSVPVHFGNSSFMVRPDYSRKGTILSGFLNVRHPLDLFNVTEQDLNNMFEMHIKYDEFGKHYLKKYGRDEYYKKFITETKELLQLQNHQLVKFHIHTNFGNALKEYGYDGFFGSMNGMGGPDGGIEYCFLEPNQFKSIKSLAFNTNSNSMYENKKKDNTLTESFEDCADFYEDHSEWDLLSEFVHDKENNVTQKKWNLIPAEQYHTLLKRYMNEPTMARIPYSVVHNWFTNIIIPNALDIYYITNLAGHSTYFPSDVVSEFFDADNIVDYKTGSEYLESIGFYDWCKLPDGSDAWSDYGLNPLFQNIHEYTPNMSAEDLLILINRCLDVVHQRGDLSSAFIQGGKNSCNYISNGIKENIENEITSDEVDLSSFNIKKKLNPKFWQDGHLDSRIRLKLLDIADDFIDFLDVDWVKPKDIIMTGSLANFNWNGEYSDIDLHILMDFSDVDENVSLVKNYFLSKKSLWNDEHKDIKIFGFPVELYVQDVDEEHDSSGVYSLDRDTWIVEPKREVLATSKVNKQFIKDKVSEYVNQIDKLIYLYKKNKDDEYKIEKISNKAHKLWDEIKNSRKKGFEISGGKEINNHNIIFKSLRRNGYLDKLYKLKTKTYDILSSL